jgi:hypothetical protein
LWLAMARCGTSEELALGAGGLAPLRLGGEQVTWMIRRLNCPHGAPVLRGRRLLRFQPVDELDAGGNAELCIDMRHVRVNGALGDD